MNTILGRGNGWAEGGGGGLADASPLSARVRLVRCAVKRNGLPLSAPLGIAPVWGDEGGASLAKGTSLSAYSVVSGWCYMTKVITSISVIGQCSHKVLADWCRRAHRVRVVRCLIWCGYLNGGI